ncbi:MAG: LacI family DNA-binding transcriptional regulator [SAR86 cluster bacterium]|nr:LacI family DNA-binding transcriptional regulator [SAR86 cluster bacterium]
MKKNKSVATMQDVAKEAKVSLKTVSRVINKEPNVSTKTIEKVQNVIDAIDYQPNSFAQTLARGKTKIIGLLYDTPSPNYISHIMEGVLTQCYKSDYEVIIHPCRFNELTLLRDVELLIKRTRLSGIITTPPLSDIEDLINLFKELNIPRVLISPGSEEVDEPSVKTNDREASRQMTNYLISKGHRRIAFIKGHPSHLSVNDRAKGFFDSLNQANIICPNELIESGLNTYQSGMDCAKRLLSLKDIPTAIFAANDEMAAGVIKVAYQNNLKIPEDLSVVGFDDTPMTKMISPPLSTIKQPLGLMGEESAKNLINQLEGGSEERYSTMNSTLIIRDSVSEIEP